MSSAELTIAPSQTRFADHVAAFFDPFLAVVAAGSCAWIAGIAWAIESFI